jgi:hypothetical protein
MQSNKSLLLEISANEISFVHKNYFCAKYKIHFINIKVHFNDVDL